MQQSVLTLSVPFAIHYAAAAAGGSALPDIAAAFGETVTILCRGSSRKSPTTRGGMVVCGWTVDGLCTMKECEECVWNVMSMKNEKSVNE